MKLAVLAAALACPMVSHGQAAPKLDISVADDPLFGSSVAVHGNLLVVGARLDSVAGVEAGSAYVYERAGNDWLLSAKLSPGSGADNDRFGHAVATDGSIIVVTAVQQSAGAPNQGTAYVYRRSGDEWVEEALLAPEDADQFDNFGGSVAIANGSIAIGAPQHSGSQFWSGACYVYEFDGLEWTLDSKLIASDSSAKRLGSSIAGDGDWIVAGATHDASGGSASGAAYVFRRIAGTWVEHAKLVASDAAPDSYFGSSVAIDGDVIAVGAWSDDEFVDEGGAAYLFNLVGSFWEEGAKVAPADLAESDRFGFSVALDSPNLVVGAYFDDSQAADAGEVYLFTENLGSWAEADQAALTSQPSGQFGNAVAIDGTQAAFCAMREEPLGATYLMSILGNGLVPEGQLVPLPHTSVSAGGTVTFQCDAGPALAGDITLVLGSLSGSSPGLPLGGAVNLPLNPDAYLFHTLTSPNVAPLEGTLGFLDMSGYAEAAFELESGSPAGWAGIDLVHAYVVLDFVDFSLKAVSNPETFVLSE